MGEAPSKGRADALIEALWKHGGTDLLLTVGMPPQIRVHGDLMPVPGEAPLSSSDTSLLLAELLSGDQAMGWADSNEYDFSFSWRDLARIRGNAFSQRGHTAVALRMVLREIPTMAQLHLPPILGEFA